MICQKKNLCNLDVYVYHYVLISIAKSINFAQLNPYNEMRKKCQDSKYGK